MDMKTWASTHRRLRDLAVPAIRFPGGYRVPGSRAIPRVSGVSSTNRSHLMAVVWEAKPLRHKDSVADKTRSDRARDVAQAAWLASPRPTLPHQAGEPFVLFPYVILGKDESTLSFRIKSNSVPYPMSRLDWAAAKPVIEEAFHRLRVYYFLAFDMPGVLRKCEGKVPAQMRDRQVKPILEAFRALENGASWEEALIVGSLTSE